MDMYRYGDSKNARKCDKITKIKHKLIKKHRLNEHRSAGGSWEEPVSAVRNTPLRRSQRLNSTLDSRSSGQLRNTLSRARELCERWRSGGGATPAPPAPPPDDEGGGRLARWFSVRRGSSHQYDMHGHETDKMPKLPELEEDLFSCGGEVRGGRVPPPSLGAPPDSLSPVQLRRRHVVAAIIHSENSYVATLQRLINETEVSAQGIYPYYGGGPLTISDSHNDDDFGLLLTVLLLATRNNNGGCCGCCNCGGQNIPIPYPIPIPTNNPIITTSGRNNNDDCNGGNGDTVNVITENESNVSTEAEANNDLDNENNNESSARSMAQNNPDPMAALQ